MRSSVSTKCKYPLRSWIWSLATKLSTELWAQSQFHNSILRCQRFRTSYSTKWRKKSFALCAATFRISHLSAEIVTSFSVSIASYSLNNRMILRMCLAVPATLEVIFFKTSTKFSKTVLTSVNFPTNALEKKSMAWSSGKPWESYRSMQCMSALNSVAIFATMKTSNTWQEPNYFSTSRENVPKWWCNAKHASRTTTVPNSPVTNA